jgi:hypothetical protein
MAKAVEMRARAIYILAKIIDWLTPPNTDVEVRFVKREGGVKEED